MGNSLIRPFLASDRAACLAVFDSNTPRFFATTERAEFAEYLKASGMFAAPYLVVARHGRIVACGGIGIAAGADGAPDRPVAEVTLDWGMVAADCHGEGLGQRLTNARLALAVRSGAQRVRLATSQHTQGFYARLGFVACNIVADGFGPGLDRWDMVWTAPPKQTPRNYPA